ncbi:MAG: purine-nucleoside phosphorylase [Thermoleophilaceae bacterium]
MALQHEIRPNHIRPVAELAERVLLPGDPGRALAVAQALLEQPPRMFNHARGLWGYTGTAPDGELLTVQATGMGGPSTAIVCEELIALGARRLVRIGTCGALDPSIELGALLAAETVLPADGTSAALGANGALEPDPGLLARLVDAGARPATVATSDLFYDPREEAAAAWMERGAVAVEMEAATVLQVAARRGVAAACVLGVSDVPGAAGARRMTDDELAGLGVRVGEAGYAAVARP